MCKWMTTSLFCWMVWTRFWVAGGKFQQCVCDATVCNPMIYAPGPFSALPGVGWLKHLNISLQCQGNGIDWQAGNTLRISDSVIQAYAQYGSARRHVTWRLRWL